MSKVITKDAAYVSYTTTARDGSKGSCYMVEYVTGFLGADGEYQCHTTYTEHYTAEGAKAAASSWAATNGIEAEGQE